MPPARASARPSVGSFGRVSRRSLLKAAARLGAGAALAALGIGRGEPGVAQEESEEPYFRESGSKLTLGNQYYEVDFDKSNGAITRIFDKRGGGVVSEGNADGSLWALLYRDEPHWAGSGAVPPSGFHAKWDGHSVLSLIWNLRLWDIEAEVTVEVILTDERWFDLAFQVDYQRGREIDFVSFPDLIGFDSDEVDEAFYPAPPGVLISADFFRERRSFTLRYPQYHGFADLGWVKRAGGPSLAYTRSSETPTMCR